MNKIVSVLCTGIWHLVFKGIVSFSLIWLGPIVKMGFKGFFQELFSWKKKVYRMLEIEEANVRPFRERNN